MTRHPGLLIIASRLADGWTLTTGVTGFRDGQDSPAEVLALLPWALVLRGAGILRASAGDAGVWPTRVVGAWIGPARTDDALAQDSRTGVTGRTGTCHAGGGTGVSGTGCGGSGARSAGADRIGGGRTEASITEASTTGVRTTGAGQAVHG